MLIEVRIWFKEGIFDAEGQTIKRALHLLGFKSVREVKREKILKLDLDEDDENKSLQLVDEMCKRLLANPVIENYTIKVLKNND